MPSHDCSWRPLCEAEEKLINGCISFESSSGCEWYDHFNKWVEDELFSQATLPTDERLIQKPLEAKQLWHMFQFHLFPNSKMK